ncbi:3-methyl-2-oxobutanoate dehydrogenase subunit VorB [Siculibacillus lacustris]|uniref:3-methyl-2-oxobutanoate dehydrogenase subunit VorB n=1 Tax=Siculibacillus lacustris TaxID=1549641 RepID=A0A4Q9VSJ6_9HYPH|nr:3-methyl-2-oxobutanoate dehydrogenase subunit VorB [Siculibacillus lacustris]TBW38991.1 3-methyl-2-oxobutanoate dehydrogenase subunit VorB [Siculibacillus lacustris]
MDRAFLKGNEAIAEAAVRAGCRFFAGYPITPQNEIPEYFSRRMPAVGGVFVQGESELASIAMVMGASCAGRRAMTSSSSPGMSLKAEGISTMAGAAVPTVIVDVARTGAGTGHIYPGQNQYAMATKAPGHGGFKVMVFAPSTVQEAVDLTYAAFDYADRDRNPVIVLADGLIGGMMEAVELPPMRDDGPDRRDWVLDGAKGRPKRVVSSIIWDGAELEAFQESRAAIYRRWAANDVRFETRELDDAEIVVVAYGTAARVAGTALKTLRAEGIKVGMIRPITVSPYPFAAFDALDYRRVRHVLSVEMCVPALMVEDVERAVGRRATVSSFGRGGGHVLSPAEVAAAVRRLVPGDAS